MKDLLVGPWPWYVAGPLIGLMAPLLLLIGNRVFALSSSLRHVCAATLPARSTFFRYGWKSRGGWNLAFVAGVAFGGFLGAVVFANPEPVAISARTAADLAALGVRDFSGLVPVDVFSFDALLGLPGLILIVGGGYLVGFGTAWGGGCTSGHGISGLANLQLPSLIATASFFGGGILATFFLLPLILRGAP